MEPINIIWAGGAPVRQVDFSACAQDLELGELSSLILSGRPAAEALKYMETLTTADPETIRLRQGGIRDLLEQPERLDALERARELIAELRVCAAGVRENARGMANGSGMAGFRETLEKLERLFGSHSGMIDEEDLDNYYGQLFRATVFSYRMSCAYTELLTLLRETFSGTVGEAFGGLKRRVDELYQQDQVEKSTETLQKLSAGWAGVGSFSVDVLVDQSLNITGVELGRVNPEPYPKAGVAAARPGEAFAGISNLSEFPAGGATARFQECLITELGASMRTALTRLRDAVCRLPVTGVQELIGLDEPFGFYLGAARFCIKLRERGGDTACPGFSEDCWIDAKGAYPPAIPLILGKLAAQNDIFLPVGGTVNFVTGANSSGKTTYLIAAGQLQWLFQLGCWLPCREAKLRPAEGMFTLFASGEADSGEDSRMGIEARKLQSFREHMTENTFLLMNEPMTSTNASEGMEICMDLLYELMEAGISSAIVTHYNEMYGMLRQRLNSGDRLVSYVMEVEQEGEAVRYPYRLSQRAPDRSSHAHEIVSQVGVTLPDMLAVLAEAGLDVRPESEAWAHLHPESEA